MVAARGQDASTPLPAVATAHAGTARQTYSPATPTHMPARAPGPNLAARASMAAFLGAYVRSRPSRAARKSASQAPCAAWRARAARAGGGRAASEVFVRDASPRDVRAMTAAWRTMARP